MKVLAILQGPFYSATSFRIWKNNQASEVSKAISSCGLLKLNKQTVVRRLLDFHNICNYISTSSCIYDGFHQLPISAKESPYLYPEKQ